MNFQPEATVQCPYCWEPIDLLIDASAGNQQYTEDCPVCCQPLVVQVNLQGDEPVVNVSREMQ